MGGKGSGRKPREYPAEIVERVRNLYGAGMTVREVQDSLPQGFKVQNIIRRYEIETRPAIKRDQVGDRNHMWRGDAAGYKALHLRVGLIQGKPSMCSACERTDDGTRYEWANLTGRYDDVTDYVRLCVPCHRRFDAATRKQAKGGDANV